MKQWNIELDIELEKYWKHSSKWNYSQLNWNVYQGWRLNVNFDTKWSKIIECIFDRRENAKREIKIVWTIPAVVIHVVVGSREKYP